LYMKYFAVLNSVYPPNSTVPKYGIEPPTSSSGRMRNTRSTGC
jgi:hypothetical protein